MKRRKALSAKNAPASLHLSFYAVVWLLMDRFDPAGWVWGVVGTICAVIFITSLIDFWTCQNIELP